MSKHGDTIKQITEEWMLSKQFDEMPKSFSDLDNELIDKLKVTNIEIQGVSIGRFNNDFITGTVNFVNEQKQNSTTQFNIQVKKYEKED